MTIVNDTSNENPQPALVLEEESQKQQQDMQQVIHIHMYHENHTISENNLRQIHEILRLNKLKLEESGWYYGQMTWVQSTALLKNTPEGTFLVRDSSDPRYVYILEQPSI